MLHLPGQRCFNGRSRQREEATGDKRDYEKIFAFTGMIALAWNWRVLVIHNQGFLLRGQSWTHGR